MNDIEILGSISGNKAYQLSNIIAALDTSKIEMVQGASFTGRPGTVIYVKDDVVVKLKYDASFKDVKVAFGWAKKHLDREASFAIHHPNKTWFVRQEGEDFVCGNVTPRLTPLHVFLQTDEPNLETLISFIAFYLEFAAKHELRLDEGLSNFGLDENQNIYYLDDDIYSWDDFLGLSQMLGVYLRTLEWITPSLAEKLAAEIYRLIIKEFKDINWIRVVFEQFQVIFVPESRKDVFSAFSAGLLDEMRNAAKVKKQKARTRVLQPQLIPPDFGRGTIAVLADVHANLPALEAVVGDIRARGISQAMVVGDIVGYGPHPSECIQLIAREGIYCIKGNHDHAAALTGGDERFSYSGRISNDWTRDQLSDEEKNWLLHLPPIFKCDNFMAVHGAPVDRTFFNAYVYHMTSESNLDYLEHHRIQLCFHGHTHMNGAYVRHAKFEDTFVTEKIIELLDGGYYLACPGSVGQPRDGMPGARYCIFDSERRTIENVHVGYDVDRVIKDMKKRAQPEPLIQFQERLLAGA